MRQIKIRKLVVNICVGDSGDRLTKAARVLSELAGATDDSRGGPVFSKGTSFE